MPLESPLGEQAVEALRRTFQETNATERLVLLDEALRLHRLARAQSYVGLSDADMAISGAAAATPRPPEGEAAE